MPIKVSWDDENMSIVVFTYEGRWGWEEFYEAVEQSNALMDKVSYPVDVIIDLRNSPLMPQNMLSHLARMPRIAHPNTGNLVAVGANNLIRVLSNLYVQIYGKNNRKFGVVYTLEAGREFLRANVPRMA